MGAASEAVLRFAPRKGKSSNQAIVDNASNELVFAVVGHVGSGTTEIAQKLVDLLKDPAAIGAQYEVSYIKATDLIADWAAKNGRTLPHLKPNEKKTIGYVTSFQDLGDAMRKETADHAAVAKAFALRIRVNRAGLQKVAAEPGVPVRPDGKPRAYVVDSIRHPAEVEFLRHLYRDGFVLVGVVCESNTRAKRVGDKYRDATGEQVSQLMDRDEKAAESYGQRVSDAFHLSDFFVDNTPAREKSDGSPNRSWDVAEKLSRLIKIIRQQDVVRPESSETAMWYAHGASMRSACLSRQVGAALLDRQGNVIATGTNEVPRAGGGVYGEGFPPDIDHLPDHRCAHRANGGEAPFCSSTREQGTIVAELVTSISEVKAITPEERDRISAIFRKGRIGQLLEFSRAVHAEMDAILNAGRKGISTVGSRLFVTTYPCHYCARHIVCAGIDEVQYIEPYPKSRALQLHKDSIQIVAENWIVPSSERATSLVSPDGQRNHGPEMARVLFRPFAGVAPRLYRRAFFKDRDLKNNLTGEMQISAPEWGSPWHVGMLAYADIEAELSKETE